MQRPYLRDGEIIEPKPQSREEKQKLITDFLNDQENINRLKKLCGILAWKNNLQPDQAEDIFQTAVQKALATTSEIQNPKAIYSWFYALCTNAAIDIKRKANARREELPLDQYDANKTFVAASPDLDTSILIQELQQKLNPNELELLEQIYFQGKSLEQIGLETGIDPNTIKQRRVRLLEKLRRLTKQKPS